MKQNQTESPDIRGSVYLWTLHPHKVSTRDPSRFCFGRLLSSCEKDAGLATGRGSSPQREHASAVSLGDSIFIVYLDLEQA
jgi:hypothetical protein